MSLDDRNRTRAPVATPCRRVAIACTLAIVLVTTAAPAKDERGVTTVGAPVPLSRSQQAALAAKRSALPATPAAVSRTPLVKVAPVVTIDTHSSVRTRERPPQPATLDPSRPGGGSGAARRASSAGPRPWSPPATHSDAPVARLLPDARSLDELRALLGPERSIAAGLVKTGSREWSGGTSKPVKERP